MDIFQMMQSGGVNPLLAMAMASKAKRQGPLGMAPDGPGLGPVGGPRALPQPIQSFDPGPSAFAPDAPLPMPQPDFSGVGPLAAPGDVSAELAARGPLAAPEAKAKRGGVFGRIGDFMGSDEGKAALLRAGAATMEGGLGQGVLAGAEFADSRRKQRIDQEHYDREAGQRDRGLSIQQQGTNQSGLYQAGQLQLGANRTLMDAMELEEAKRKNIAGEQLTQRQQDILRENNIRTVGATMRGQDVSRANTLDQVAVSRENNIRSTGVQERGQDLQHFDRSEDRAWQYGPERTTTLRNADGDPIGTSEARIPAYGDIRMDPATGKYYRLDPATGSPVEVQAPRQFVYGAR